FPHFSTLRLGLRNVAVTTRKWSPLWYSEPTEIGPNDMSTRFAQALLTLTVLAAPLGATEKVKIADGIYQFITEGHGDAGLDGNSTVIISNDGVLVFDTNCVPSTAAEILKEIRQLTSQPVNYVVNSHWHWDHWSGNQVYKAAFPNVQIITSTKNRDQMKNVS